MITTTTITTEAELDALPVGSVVLDRHEYPWRKGCGSWVCTSDGGVIEPIKVTPLTVLHVPGQPAPTVKPSRDALEQMAAEAIDGADVPVGAPPALVLDRQAEAVADAVLALLPGLTEREARAAAWDQGYHHGRRRIAAHPSENPYRDEVERGEGRG